MRSKKTKSYGKGNHNYKSRSSKKGSKVPRLNQMILSNVLYKQLKNAFNKGNYSTFKKIALSLPQNISLDDVYLNIDGIKTYLYDRYTLFNDVNERSLIFIAIEKNDMAFLKKLLNSAFKNSAHEYAYYYKVDDILGTGADPLILASHMGNTEAVRLLLKVLHDRHIKDSISQNLSFDYDLRAQRITPLWAAVNRGHIQISKELLKKGVDVNKPNVSSYTPLHVAVSNNDIEMVKLLLDSGADKSKKTITEETPLHLAVLNNDIEMVKLLLDYGADKSKKNITGDTPLNIAKKKKYIEIQEMLNSNNKH